MKNRAIKFRFYDPDTKNMISWEEARKNGFRQDDWKVMQYTGLTDKQAIMIFESDLVELNNGDIKEVKWEKQTGFGFSGWNIEAGREYKIIGNIFENPELLERRAR